jgi:hypothetical protein
MPIAPPTPPRRAAIVVAFAGVVLGGLLYVRGLTTAHDQPGRGLLWVCSAITAVATALGWIRSGGRVAALAQVLPTLLLLLAPSALLLSIPAAYAASLGFAHPLSLGSLLLTALAPLALALRVARLEEAALVRWRANGLAAGASLLLTLLSLELGVRLLGLDPSSPLPRFHETPFHTLRSAIPRVRWELAPNQRWKTIYPSNERGYFDADNAVAYRTNDAGYRGDHLGTERTSGARRVALLGDSFAFGLGVKENDTLARHLEALLSREATCPTEVLNFAVPGYGTDQEEALLRRRVLSYAPDVAVVWYFLNDVEIEGTLGFLGGDKPRGFFPVARRASALARLVSTRLDAHLSLLALVQTYRDAYRPTDPRWHVVEAAFVRLGRTARLRGVKVVVFVHPILFRLGPSYPFAAVHRQVVAAAQSAGLEAYDLADAFAGKRAEDLWVHRTDQHPNEIAHALAAAFAAERIRPLLPACGVAGR